MKLTLLGWIWLFTIILISILVTAHFTLEATEIDMDSFIDTLPSGDCGGGCIEELQVCIWSCKYDLDEDSYLDIYGGVR